MTPPRHEAEGAKKNRSGTRSRDREQRWDEIIVAAAEVFYEKGYEGASLQDIASSVGLLKGSIYYYIQTKEDLLFELVLRAQKAWHDVIDEGEPLSGLSAPTRLRFFIHRWMRLKQQHQRWGVVAEREFSRLSPDYLKVVVAGRRRFTAFVDAMLEKGREEGHFDDRVEPRLATTMVFEALKSGHLAKMPRGEAALVAHADAYATMLIRGLGYAGWEPSIAQQELAAASG